MCIFYIVSHEIERILYPILYPILVCIVPTKNRSFDFTMKRELHLLTLYYLVPTTRAAHPDLSVLKGTTEKRVEGLGGLRLPQVFR
jgi:hypothetical protein